MGAVVRLHSIRLLLWGQNWYGLCLRTRSWFECVRGAGSAFFESGSATDAMASTTVRRLDWRGGWSFSARVRDFQKLLVILPTSACVEAASGGF